MKENSNTDQGLVCKQNKGPVADIHPIKTGNYTIPTDEMFSLYEYMCTAIDIGFDGSIIYGNAYTGKSYAIRQLTTWFEEKRNQKHATYRISLSNKVYSYKEFFQYISEQIGCASDGRRLDGERVAEHLINALIFYGHMHGDKIVLILDEAETLQVTHYKSLKYLFNRLSDAKIKLVTFLVGTEALLNSREVFVRSGSIGEQITRRFMQGEHHFHGITDTNKLQYILNGYDKQTYNGQTYTQYFFPEAWERGCRLSDLSEVMTDTILKKTGLDKLPEFPMGYFTKMINALFITFGRDTEKIDTYGRSSRKDWITYEEIEKMISMLNLDSKLIELSAKGKQ